MKRKIIQCWCSMDTHSESTDYGLRDFTEITHFALCDDGTTWEWTRAGWRECFGPMPQPEETQREP